jgi:opacity protein-like surface antigen
MFGITVAIVLGATVSVFSLESPISELQHQVNEFSDTLARSLPFNASLGLNWSDAYIGQLIGAPPHFGIGLSGGLTTMDLGSFEDVAGLFGISMPVSINLMPMPGYTVEGRIGGFILPFDVGFKCGVLPPVDFSRNFQFDYTLVGGDIRYAVLKGPILPHVSVGVGLNYLKGDLSTVINGSGPSFTFGGNTLALSDPEIGFSWETTSLDFKAQISKSLFIITPYLGLGVSHGWSKAGYTVESNLWYNGKPVKGTDLKAIRATIGDDNIDLTGQGFSSIIKNTGWGFRAFGGLSFNLLVIRLDLTGMYNFLDRNLGGSFGVRFQL